MEGDRAVLRDVASRLRAAADWSATFRAGSGGPLTCSPVHYRLGRETGRDGTTIVRLQGGQDILVGFCLPEAAARPVTFWCGFGGFSAHQVELMPGETYIACWGRYPFLLNHARYTKYSIRATPGDLQALHQLRAACPRTWQSAAFGAPGICFGGLNVARSPDACARYASQQPWPRGLCELPDWGAYTTAGSQHRCKARVDRLRRELMQVTWAPGRLGSVLDWEESRELFSPSL